MNKTKLMSLFIIVVGIIFLVIACILFVKDFDKPISKLVDIKIVDCYDKFGNEIIGQQCEKLEYKMDNIILHVGAFAFMGSLLLVAGYEGISDDER